MSDAGMLEEFLAGACVDAAVFALRPDYRALLLAAEAAAREALSSGPAEQLRTWRRGGRPTGRSAPSRNAPATAWRRSCAVRRPGCPG